ncbi:MAG: hypothetical protein RSD57_07185 [Comamonas sp.]
MKIANLNTAASALYDTPPHGDFVRYVDKLMEMQAAGVVLHAHTTAPGMVQKAAAAAKPVAASDKPASQGVIHKADELLDRIRQLEARRHGALAAPAGPANNKRSVFEVDESKLNPAPKLSGWKVLWYLALTILGLVFPPLGVVMLIAAFKKGFSANAKN